MLLNLVLSQWFTFGTGIGNGSRYLGAVRLQSQKHFIVEALSISFHFHSTSFRLGRIIIGLAFIPWPV